MRRACTCIRNEERQRQRDINFHCFFLPISNYNAMDLEYNSQYKGPLCDKTLATRNSSLEAPTHQSPSSSKSNKESASFTPTASILDVKMAADLYHELGRCELWDAENNIM